MTATMTRTQTTGFFDMTIRDEFAQQVQRAFRFAMWAYAAMAAAAVAWGFTR